MEKLIEKLIEEDEKIDRRDEEIDGKLIKEDDEMAHLPLNPFWLKEDLIEYFTVVLMCTFNFF
jgi:hypothetical protein